VLGMRHGVCLFFTGDYFTAIFPEYSSSFMK